MVIFKNDKFFHSQSLFFSFYTNIFYLIYKSSRTYKSSWFRIIFFTYIYLFNYLHFFFNFFHLYSFTLYTFIFLLYNIFLFFIYILFYWR